MGANTTDVATPRAAVLAGLLLTASAASGVWALHDTSWHFGWDNPHFQEHWAGIAAFVAFVHVVFACIDRPADERVRAMAPAVVPLAASLVLGALPFGQALLPAMGLLVVYLVALVRGAGRRGRG